MKGLLLALLVATLGCGSKHKAGQGADDGGVDDDAGTTVWTPVPAPDVNYFSVHGTAIDDVIIVGGAGTILRWNGMDLLPESSGTDQDLHSVFAVAKDLAYAVGANGAAVKWDGTAWTVLDTGMTGFLNAVYADATQAIAVGAAGSAVRFDGTAWTPVPADSPDDLFGITNGGSEILAVGTLGTIAHYNATTGFHRTAVPGFFKTLSGVTTGASYVWLVGVDGALIQYGGSFPTIAGIPNTFLRSVTAPGHVWVVGWDGALARYGAPDVFIYPPPDARRFQAIYGAADNDIWIVGSSGLVLHGPPTIDPMPLGGM